MSRRYPWVVDNTAPETAIETSEPNYDGDDGHLYVTSATIFTLAAEDELSGIAVTEYRVDGREWTVYKPFVIDGEGEHLIEYRSHDQLGNLEAVNAYAVTIDNAPPQTIINVAEPKFQSDNGPLFVGVATIFTFSAADNLTGISKTEYRIDDGSWSAYAPFRLSDEGPHSISFRSVDMLGNQEAVQKIEVIVDNSSPVTTASVNGTQHVATDGTLYVGRASTVSLSADDNLSGVSLTEYRLDWRRLVQLCGSN